MYVLCFSATAKANVSAKCCDTYKETLLPCFKTLPYGAKNGKICCLETNIKTIWWSNTSFIIRIVDIKRKICIRDLLKLKINIYGCNLMVHKSFEYWSKCSIRIWFMDSLTISSLSPEIWQSTICYTWLLGRWDKRFMDLCVLMFQVLFFFMISCKILFKKPLFSYFLIKL